MSVIFDCRVSFYTQIPTCWEEITVNLGIAPGTYWYKITTPYGKTYMKEVVIAAEESGFQLLASDFPVELFNPWIGLFDFRLYAQDSCTPVSAVICDIEYQSIIIKPVQMETPPAQIKLVCQCQEP